MNLDGTFDSLKYKELINYLDSIKDLKYREFHKKIAVYDDVIGVKIDDLRRIAKTISKGDYKGFIKCNNSSSYELILIEGLIYGYIKIPFNELKDYLEVYFKKVKTWAEVDSVVANLKIFNKERKNGFNYAKKLIHNKNPFIKRFGIVILLDYYLHDDYINQVLEVISKVKSDDYYVKMAVSWLMSVSYIKYKEKTLVYLVNINDEFIYNKTLSKIIESRRIDAKEKEFIRSLRKKEKN